MRSFTSFEINLVNRSSIIKSILTVTILMMHSYSLIAPAKINLYLEIIGDRPDGFHELVMILQSIELADSIEIAPSDDDNISLYCKHPQVPKDKTNLAYRAAQLMCELFPDTHARYGGIKIKLVKNIPIAAGLAGGSADAAAVLVGVDLMWNLGLTQPDLQEIASKLGSDIPFCLAGGTAIATGRGEKLDSIADLDHLWVVLAKYNNIGVSTPWAYTTYRQQYRDTYVSEASAIQSRTAKVHSSPLVKAISHKNGAEIGKLMHNDLEKVVLPEHLKVSRLKEAFAATNVLGTMISGSGPTVFALCDTQEQAITAKNKVSQTIDDPDLEFWVTKLTSNGIHLTSN